jgi:hypothetical protein
MFITIQVPCYVKRHLKTDFLLLKCAKKNNFGIFLRVSRTQNLCLFKKPMQNFIIITKNLDVGHTLS